MSNNHNNEEKSYLFFVLAFGLATMLAAFLISTIIFKGLINNNNPAGIACLVMSILLFIGSMAAPIIRFFIKRKILGFQIADGIIFFSTFVFFFLFGFFPALFDSFAYQHKCSALHDLITTSWSIFGITACLYTIIIGLITVFHRKWSKGLVVNIFITLPPIVLNALINATATIYIFAFSHVDLSWANTLGYTAIVFSSLNIIYYVISSISLTIKAVSNKDVAS